MGLHFFVDELVFYLLAEVIAMKLYYFGGLNHFKPDFQFPYYLIKAIFFGTYFDGSHAVCLHICSLWLVLKIFFERDIEKGSLSSTPYKSIQICTAEYSKSFTFRRFNVLFLKLFSLSMFLFRSYFI